MLSGKVSSEYDNIQWSIECHSFCLSINVHLFAILGYAPSKYGSAIHSVNYSSAADSKPTSDEPIVMDNPFKKDERQCILCTMGITPNYKNVRLLSQFQSPHTGRIYGRHITGLCRAKQAQVETEIRKAQDVAFMPVYLKSPEFLRDARLFDPERPLRPHKY